MKDIDRFSESRMNDKFRGEFFRNVPSHIRDMVNWKGDGAAVLQGYRGPYSLRDNSSGDSETLVPSYGVQEIKFYHAMSKKVNTIPIAGTLAFGITRLVEYAADHSDWVSAYFDETSGDIISYSQAQENKSKNRTAENHYSEGVNYEQQNDYKKAIEAFQKAYNACTRGYKNETFFQICKNRVKNGYASYWNSKGNDHENNRRYQEASEMYNKAYETCADNCEHKELYKRNQDRAEINWRNGERNSRAKKLHEIGKSLSRSIHFNQAVIKFNEALNEAVENVLITSIMKSKSETLKKWGTQLENMDDVDGALAKYREALESVVDETSRRQIEANVARIISQNNTAEKHYEEGVHYEKQKNFEAASDAFQKAYDAFTCGYKNKALFLSCKQRSQNKRASFWNSQGNDHENNRRYQEATEMYNKAYETCADNCDSKDIYLRNQERAEINWRNGENISRANILREIGKSFSSSSNFNQAVINFNEALNEAVDASPDNALITAIMKSKSETLNEWATQLENIDDIDGALAKYREALESVVDDTSKRRIEANVTRVKGIISQNNTKERERVQYEKQNKIDQLEKSGDIDGAIKSEAKVLYAKATKLWNDAWKAEDGGEEDKAETKFWEVSSLLIQASNKDPTNGYYKRLLNMCKLKIEGNALFNEGLMLQVEACRLKQQQKYKKAQSKYREALKKFQEGYNSTGNDEKFKSCIDFITEVINEVSNTVEASTSRVMHRNDISQSADASDFERDFIQTIGMISRLDL